MVLCWLHKASQYQMGGLAITQLDDEVILAPQVIYVLTRCKLAIKYC